MPKSNVLITALDSRINDGAGWVSRNIEEWHQFERISLRNSSFLNKVFHSLKGCLLIPFLHPIFTRYIPASFVIANVHSQLWLNFSQTFGTAFFVSNCILICHDLQCHRKHNFTYWVRWSERILLQHARLVVVLSNRDLRLIHRYYSIPISNIENIGPRLLKNLIPFSKSIHGPVKSVLFLGTLSRMENFIGMHWFEVNVLPYCPQLKVYLVGAVDKKRTLLHKQFHYLGFVDNLEDVFNSVDLMIAPMQSVAGIKIKVIEALQHRLPVLGTAAAYSGIDKPASSFISDEPSDWIRCLNNTTQFSYPKSFI
jgi:hypothetical protein